MILWGRANIAGFTFLEFPRVERKGNKTTYTAGTQTFTEDEVLVLPGGTDPNDLYAGYSPSGSHAGGDALDDYIADFQAGFSRMERYRLVSSLLPHRGNHFESSAAMLQDAQRGAVAITMSPTRTDQLIKTGKPSTTAVVEWCRSHNRTKILTSRTYRLIGGLTRHLACRQS